MLKNLKQRAGMTLVEVIVALAILSICSLLLFSGFGVASNFFNGGTTEKIGGNEASSQIEQQDFAGTNTGTADLSGGKFAQAFDGTYKETESNGVRMVIFDADN